MTADTIDHRFLATPGQVDAIERDGFLAVVGPTGPTFQAVENMPMLRGLPVPTTKPCPECGGRGSVDNPDHLSFRRDLPCTGCGGYDRNEVCRRGSGTVPITVEVVVPERAACQNCTNGFVMGLYGPEDCICDQGSVSLCLRCGQPYELDHSPVKYGGVPVAQHRNRSGSKTVECPDGSGWIIPARTLLRGTAEAVPVVDRFDGLCSADSCLVSVGGGFLLIERVGEDRFTTDVTHHFADVPRPEVGDTAWIIRGEG